MANAIIDISCTGANTYVNAGAVAGENFGLVQDCYATGSVTARNKSNQDGGSYKENSYAGGICGISNMGIIERCYSDVSTYATSNLDTAYAAGITASNYYSEVRSCFALGSVSTSDVGGGVSGSGGTATNCYASNAQSVNARYYAVSGTKVDPYRKTTNRSKSPLFVVLSCCIRHDLGTNPIHR